MFGIRVIDLDDLQQYPELEHHDQSQMLLPGILLHLYTPGDPSLGHGKVVTPHETRLRPCVVVAE